MNQPIPKRGRKPSSESHLFKLERNQPIPTRGRKLSLIFMYNILAMNQPIPKRGRKFFMFLLVHFFIHSEPTHPKAGTKISIDKTGSSTSNGTNPSPLGDENLPFGLTLCLFFKNHPIPKRGRKIYSFLSFVKVFQNQPIPRWGRKSLSV